MPKPDFSSLPDRVKSRIRDNADGTKSVTGVGFGSGKDGGSKVRDVVILRPTYKTWRLAKEADSTLQSEAATRVIVSDMTGLSLDELDRMDLSDYVDIVEVVQIPFGAALGGSGEDQTEQPG